uniref:Uncharacterized protein n=1 Tax=Lactuca sativa TaxID=4236 RepID=A0A9R1WZJ4_LACSA|nr:hypothetical protein LSAT_V11C700377200 [Lactuca sativa]
MGWTRREKENTLGLMGKGHSIKNDGGLVVGSFCSLNISLLVKLKTENHSLWTRLIIRIYNLLGKPYDYLEKQNKSRVCGIILGV